MTMLRGRGAYMNLGVLVGHSAVRTAVMGDDASVRKEPIADELGISRAQLALAWVLRQAGVSSVITGATRPADQRGRGPVGRLGQRGRVDLALDRLEVPGARHRGTVVGALAHPPILAAAAARPRCRGSRPSG